MNLVDLKYCGIISPYLEGYKVKGSRPYRANFRCPICGDSKKSRSKMRGWILENPKKDMTGFYCHNCHTSLNLGSFIEKVSPSVFKDYKRDKGLEKYGRKEVAKPALKKQDDITEIRKKPANLRALKSVSSLNIEHPAKKYVTSRGIPSNVHYKLYYAKDFNGWINTLLPEKLNEEIHEARLVIPFFDSKGNVFGVTGRSLKPDSNLRYITIMFDDSKPKVFGLDTVNFDHRYYVLEGALDSFFIKNSIAMAGADFDDSILKNKEKAMIIFDLEPRNKEIVHRIEKMIDEGYNVVLWPEKLKEYGKDVNDFVLAGVDIKREIRANTYQGLKAKLQLAKWREI